MINYPSGVNRTSARDRQPKPSFVNYGRRGMSLEDRLNQSNEYYLTHNRCVVHKKPTPIQVVNVDYPRRSAAKITEAYYRRASTTDFNGVYRGYYLDFEAKETQNKGSFPLANIPDHQMTHMEQCVQQEGIAFFIISFAVHDQVFVLPYQTLREYCQSSDRKSIPYEYIQTHAIECSTGIYPMIDYLPAVDQLIDQYGSRKEGLK